MLSFQRLHSTSSSNWHSYTWNRMGVTFTDSNTFARGTRINKRNLSADIIVLWTPNIPLLVIFCSGEWMEIFVLFSFCVCLCCCAVEIAASLNEAIDFMELNIVHNILGQHYKLKNSITSWSASEKLPRKCYIETLQRHHHSIFFGNFTINKLFQAIRVNGKTPLASFYAKHYICYFFFGK